MAMSEYGLNSQHSPKLKLCSMDVVEIDQTQHQATASNHISF
jgi:hypothetical protein